MIPQHTLKLNEITVSDRFRRDLGNLEGLKASLTRIGLVQPIIIDRNKRLVAGGRRYAAATELGWDSIAVSYREVATEADHYEAELEENKHRKDFTWQEECQLIEKIHFEKVRANSLEGKKWGFEATAGLFNIGKMMVSYSLRLARELTAEPEGELAKAATATDAWRILMRREQTAARAELARRQLSRSEAALDALTAPVEPLFDLERNAGDIPENLDIIHVNAIRERARMFGYHELNEGEAKTLYLSFGHPEDGFAEYHQRQIERAKNKHLTVDLSKWLIKMDCLSFMADPANVGRFDHIITDPPYAIDMSMLEQASTGMSNIESVKKEHVVEENVAMLQTFVYSAYNCLKEGGYCILWCDYMMWQFLYDLGVDAGFKVQRWPFVWVKTHQCMNQAAKYNFTKSTEIAVVMRKNGVLARAESTNYEVAGHDDMKEEMDHPFVKPFAVWNRLVQAVSIQNQVIFDPFAGRGSGVMSMLRTNRSVVACEINDDHYNALMENVKQYYLNINPDYVFI